MRDAAPGPTLKLAALLTVIFFLIEAAGGFISGSLSLLGDAWHMLRDVLALLITLSAINVAERLPTKARTFGFTGWRSWRPSSTGSSWWASAS